MAKKDKRKQTKQGMGLARYAEVRYRDYPKDYTFEVPDGMGLEVGDCVVVERRDPDPEPTFLVCTVTRLLPAPLCEGVRGFDKILCKVPVRRYMRDKERAEVRGAVRAQLADALAEHEEMERYSAAAQTNREIAELLEELSGLAG